MWSSLRIVVFAALTIVGFVGFVGVAGRCSAAPPWKSLLPFQTVEADPNKPYELTPEQGPWLILAANFSGDGGREQARRLVYELRKRYKLHAYIHEQTYDYTGFQQGKGLTPDGRPKRMRHLRNTRYKGVAVLVGDFEYVDDPRLQKALEVIKYARPECLRLQEGQRTNQRMAVLREFQKKIMGDNSKRARGPMGFAFAARNPLLEKELFAPRGLDPLVLKLNKGAEYSLLDCPGKFTVKVATFKGVSTMKLNEIEKYETGGLRQGKLMQAAEKAHQLTTALRGRNVEAYVFHDLHESLVTVGSFDRVGAPLQGGRTNLDPAIHQIIEAYRARPQKVAGVGVGLQPRVLKGIPIPFDVQPTIIQVPRASIASDYAPSNKLFR